MHEVFQCVAEMIHNSARALMTEPQKREVERVTRTHSLMSDRTGGGRRTTMAHSLHLGDDKKGCGC